MYGDLNLRMSGDIAMKHLITLGGTSKPSVKAAYFRTLYSGWCTQRRFRFCAVNRQQKNYCFICCGVGCDSIEHYAQCSTIVDFFASVGLNNFEPNINCFLMIQRGLSPARISLHARCLYAVYITHCIIRHSTDMNFTVERVRETLRAAFKRAGNR